VTGECKAPLIFAYFRAAEHLWFLHVLHIGVWQSDCGFNIANRPFRSGMMMMTTMTMLASRVLVASRRDTVHSLMAVQCSASLRSSTGGTLATSMDIDAMRSRVGLVRQGKRGVWATMIGRITLTHRTRSIRSITLGLVLSMTTGRRRATTKQSSSHTQREACRVRPVARICSDVVSWLRFNTRTARRPSGMRVLQ